MNLSGYFASRFGCQANAENDANLAEHWRGCARHIDDVVYILAGRRTGAGMIVGGRLHRGPNGAAGEMGNLRLLGWWDAPGDLEAHGADAEAVFSAAPGDLEPADAVRAYASALANCISALVLTLDPDLVVIGGGLSRAGDQLLLSAAEERCLPQGMRSGRFLTSRPSVGRSHGDAGGRWRGWCERLPLAGPRWAEVSSRLGRDARLTLWVSVGSFGGATKGG